MLQFFVIYRVYQDQLETQAFLEDVVKTVYQVCLIHDCVQNSFI